MKSEKELLTTASTSFPSPDYAFFSSFFVKFDWRWGVSANAYPHTNKLRTRDTHIWGIRRRQLNRSAMEEPLPGGTAAMITVSSVPGKYAG